MAPLHPEWTAFVAQNPDISHDDDQRNGRFYSNPANREFTTRVLIRDTTVPGRDGHPIPIRIYRAKETQTTKAIVFFFHSGGFRVGSLETEDITCRYIALAGPLTVISVEYRMPPAHVYPVPINDAWDSLEYTIRHMSIIIPDVQQQSPVKLVLSGTSAGGQLAGILSQRTQDWLKGPANAEINDRVRLVGVLLRAPVTVRGTDPEFIPPRFRDMHRSWCQELETARLDRLDMGENHDALQVPASERLSPSVYPLWGDLKGLPRTYIQLCGVDILRDDGVCYAQALRDAGVEVQETLYEDLPHIFWMYGPDLQVSRTAQADLVKGLLWLLEG